MCATLRYLASGYSYKDAMFSFRVADNTISEFIPEVLEAIIQEYMPEVMPGVVTPEGWLAIANLFEQR